MPRLVKKTAQGPHQVGETYICMCGLSQNQPYCDGHHKHTLKEEAGKLYWYDGDKVEEIETVIDECCGGEECGGHCDEGGCCGHCSEEKIDTKTKTKK